MALASVSPLISWHLAWARCLAARCVSGATKRYRLKSHGATWIFDRCNGSSIFGSLALLHMVVGVWALLEYACCSLVCLQFVTLYHFQFITAPSSFDHWISWA